MEEKMLNIFDGTTATFTLGEICMAEAMKILF